MIQAARPLPLDAYRALVALDEPVPSRAPEPQSAALLLRTALDHLEKDGTAERLRQMMGGPLTVKNRITLLRALLTVRIPAPLPEEVHRAIETVLLIERSARTIVEAAGLPSFTMNGLGKRPSLALWQGDITTLKIDAIVNAANSHLIGCFTPFHPCIDNAIHWAAGPRLREDCDRIVSAQAGLEPTGCAKATRAYSLPSRFVLHTVGPIVAGPLDEQHKADLARCYRACLETAAQLGDVRSIAFCGISTGVFGFPKDAAARIALETTRDWLLDHPNTFDHVVFNVFTDQDKAAYVDALDTLSAANSRFSDS